MSDPRISFVESLAAYNSKDILQLLATKIRIKIASQSLKSFSGQVLTYQLATLVYRLFDNVTLEGDDSIQAHPDMKLITGPFIPGLRTVLPTLRPVVEAAPATTEISITLGSSELCNSDLFLGSTGWGVRFSTVQPQIIDDTRNIVGALAAGAIGASEIFKRIFKEMLKASVVNNGYELSLLDYRTKLDITEPALPSLINLDAVLFGCGSIGCGVILGILLTPQLNGNLTLVDNGRFDKRNPYKYSLVDYASAASEGAKALWAKKCFDLYAKERVAAEHFVGVCRQYISSLTSDYKLRLAISAVDTIEGRAEIQDVLPYQIVNAGIEGTLAEVSVHDFGNKGACLGCLALQRDYESWSAKPIADAIGLSQERVYTLIKNNGELTSQDIANIKASGRAHTTVLSGIESFIGQPILSLWNRIGYSEASIQSSGRPTAHVATAFVSAFAGTLILSEVFKNLVPDLHKYQINNSYRQEMLGIPAESIFRYPRDSKGWCLCHSSFRQSIYREKYHV